MKEKRFDQVNDVRLVYEKTETLKALSGFQKQHRAPKTVGPGDIRFFNELSHKDVDADLDQKFDQLRSAFGFKRKEMAVSGPADGMGVISTPFFNYEVSFALDAEQPSRFIITRAITGISQPEQIINDAFDDVFGAQFSVLEIRVTTELDIETIIDRIEDIDSDDITLNYDKSATFCEIRHANSLGYSVRITPELICVNSDQRVAPNELLKTFLNLQNDFMESLVWGEAAV